MLDPSYCAAAQNGDFCLDDNCSKRHDVLRCEQCNCSLPASTLQQHLSGREHLRNVASDGPHNTSTLSPSPPSQSASSSRQSMPTANISPPSENTSTSVADPRVTVSGEEGLDFVVEGSGTETNPSFSSIAHSISIEKTSVSSSLSVESVAFSPSPSSCFTVSLGGPLVVKQSQPRKIIVSFQASCVGTFNATLRITFRDKTRPNDQEFTLTRELRGRATLPSGSSSNGDTPNIVEDMAGSEGTGITISHDFGLEFSVESPPSGEPFETQTKELIITKSLTTPLVTLKTVRVCSQNDPATASGTFSAQLEGDSKQIKPRQRRIVTVSFIPLREGLCEVALELIFYNYTRKVDFMVKRTLSGWVKRPTGGHGGHQNGSARILRSQPIIDQGSDHGSVSTDEEEEEFLDSDGTGISVSEEDGLDFGIVERRRPNGPFAAPSSSLTIKLADGFPAVTFIKERIKTQDRSESGFLATFEGNSHTIRPGTECAVCIIFNPKFEGVFKATLELLFYDDQQSARFVVRRLLQGAAGSVEDHQYFESFDQEDTSGPTRDHGYVPPPRIISLSPPNRRRNSRKFPDYEVPPIVQEAVENSSVARPFDKQAPDLIRALRPMNLTIDTYAQYFNALLNVEDGHDQWDVLCQPFYVVEVEKHGNRCSVEIENHDEDLLPEVILGDYLWLDDMQEDLRYEARITRAEVFARGQGRSAVLRMSLRLPTDFNLYRGAQFILRFRLNRITLRRQYHAMASLSSPPRRLLFPSVADIKPMHRLSSAEINNLDLVNGDIRDDDQQLQTVVSILQQPKGTVPFIIFGPPGTGKTSTVVESIVQLLRRDARARILACTPSNAAADLLVERLGAAGLDSDHLYRLNAYSREEDIPDDVQTFSLIPTQEKLLAFRVVLSTCSSAGMLQTLRVPVGHFSHIFIDEAAQAPEPLVMIPIVAFSNAHTNIILAGDPNQLGPVIKSPTANKFGLGKSYLERLMHLREVYKLETHSTKTIIDLQRNRRSHGAIIAWPNRYFYQDRMRAYGNVDITHHLLQSDVLPKKDFPVVFHGIVGNEKRTKRSPSYFNIHEATVVRNYCAKLIEDTERRIYPEDIGVIAPYRAQVRAIRELLKQARLGEISVGSVEQFQGQERKVIIMATTRSNEEYHPRKALGFLMNPRRLNVAITRAQSLLIVIGDPEVLGKSDLWRTFLDYIRLRKGSTGREPNWRAGREALVPALESIPRPGGVVYGEEFIDGKSENIYRYDLD